MSLKDKGNRIVQLRDDIRAKILSLGIITNKSAKLSDCEAAITGINDSAITASSISITPTVTINSSTGVITATGSGTKKIAASAGYSKGVSKSMSASVKNTYSLPIRSAQVITPGTANKTIAGNQYTIGTQTIAGDADLIAANIKSGVSIFGVAGNAKTINAELNSGDKYVLGKNWYLYENDDINAHRATITGLKRLSGDQDWYSSSIYCIQIENLGFTPVFATLNSNTKSGTDYLQYTWMTAWGALVYRQTRGTTYEGDGMLVSSSSLSMTASKLLIPVFVLSTSRYYSITIYGYY